MEVKNFRAVLPNDFELEKRDSIRRSIINVSLRVKEAVRTRAFTRNEVSVLDTLKEKEQSDFIDFCDRFPMFEGIFYPQFLKGTNLSREGLEALDYIQNIKNSRKRLIHQLNSVVDLNTFSTRINEFIESNPDTDNIPLLGLDVNTTEQRMVLRQKVEWLNMKGFRKVGVIFRGRKAYSRSWNVVLPRLKEEDIETYVFEVPTKKDGEFSPLIYPIMMGANKICHKRNIQGWNGTPHFIERTWEVKPYPNISDGVARYGNKNRKQFLNDDGRKTIVYPFSKWDTVVQANEFCDKDLTVTDLREVVQLKKAFSHFS